MILFDQMGKSQGSLTFSESFNIYNQKVENWYNPNKRNDES